MVHKRTVRSVVKNIVCNDRIIALKLPPKPVSILILQVHMPISKEEDDKVEKLYGVNTEIHTQDRKGAMLTVLMEDWNSVTGDKLYGNTVRPCGLRRR